MLFLSRVSLGVGILIFAMAAEAASPPPRELHFGFSFADFPLEGEGFQIFHDADFGSPLSLVVSNQPGLRSPFPLSKFVILIFADNDIQFQTPNLVASLRWAQVDLKEPRLILNSPSMNRNLAAALKSAAHLHRQFRVRVIAKDNAFNRVAIDFSPHQLFQLLQTKGGDQFSYYLFRAIHICSRLLR